MANSVEEIEQVLVKFKLRTQSEFEYALYLTLDLSNICELFFDYTLNTAVRDKLIRQIKARTERNGEELPNVFIEKLLFEFNRSDKKYRRSLGKVINDFRGVLTKDQAALLIKNQVGSNKISDRKRAYEMCEIFYSNDIDEKLWVAWNAHSDENCLNILTKFTSAEKLANNFFEIWNSDCKFRIRNAALKRVAQFDFGEILFLKETEPVSYLTACVAAKKDVDEKFIWDVIDGVNKINSFGYVLWCLGMLGKRELLTKVLEESERIESKLKIETWEPAFYGF